MHHEVLGMLLHVEVLQKDAIVAELEFARPVIAPLLCEPQLQVELPGQREIPGGYEGFEIEYSKFHFEMHLFSE